MAVPIPNSNAAGFQDSFVGPLLGRPLAGQYMANLVQQNPQFVSFWQIPEGAGDTNLVTPTEHMRILAPRAFMLCVGYRANLYQKSGHRERNTARSATASREHAPTKYLFQAHNGSQPREQLAVSADLVPSVIPIFR